MRTIHVHHQFQPVGHGTFLTGELTDEHSVFRWVYDCGSKRSTRVAPILDTLAGRSRWPGDSTLDMVVVSHFDNDHVNGLEDLIRQYKVKWLVLPYLATKQRLAHAASLDGGDVSSSSTAAFAIYPAGYVAARGLSDRVAGILLVRGGRGDGAGDGGDELPDPQPDGPEDMEGVIREKGSGMRLATTVQFGSAVESALGSAGAPGIRLHGHRQPIRAKGMPFEFVFFNTALPDGRANRSRQPIAVIDREVATIMARFDMLSPSRTAPAGWRKALKDCYLRHFGSSGLDRNNISLCLMARPLAMSPLTGCGWFEEDELLEQEIEAVLVPVEHDRQSLLMTGDLTLDAAVIAEMQSHFRDWRWRQLGVTQVPHHGSRHSWAAGNAALFPAPQFVHCVPGTTGRHVAHPHPTVEADLKSCEVHHATYGRTVLHTYHFDA
jgi:hypothetical protein